MGAHANMNPIAAHLTQSWLRRGPTACALWPISLVLLGLTRLRRHAYHTGWAASGALPVPVLVVGNRIAGGAGKTPTTIAVLQHLRALGWRPGVLTRGYKADLGEQKHVLLDSSSESTLRAHQTGDEPMLIWRRTHCPLAIGANRLAAGQSLLQAHPDLNILVCDDGLQHLKLQRQMEVVVFDERGQGNGWLLPAGPLREPIHTPSPPQLAAAPLVIYNAPHPTTPLPGFIGVRHMKPLVSLQQWWSSDAQGSKPPQAGANVRALAGIAQPQKFFDALETMGYRVEGIALDDHADFESLPWQDGPIDLIVTEKDAIKLDPERMAQQRPLTRIWVAGLDFELDPAFWAQFNAILDRLPSKFQRPAR